MSSVVDVIIACTDVEVRLFIHKLLVFGDLCIECGWILFSTAIVMSFAVTCITLL